jgi:hypothetical protein
MQILEVTLFLVEIRYQHGMPFSGFFALGTRLSEVKTFGNALGYTGRFQALVDPIHAVITFDCFAGFRVPLGCAPGAGRDARLAAHTKLIINEDNAVFRPFLHRPGRTGGDAPGILAVKTRHKHIGHAWQIVDFSGADGDYLAQSRPDGQIIFCLAMGFAAETSDAALGILVDVVLAHLISSGR